MKYTINQHIGIFENAYSKEFCNKIIDIFNQNPQLSKDRQSGGKEGTKLKKNDTFTFFTQHFPEIKKEFITKFFDTFYPYYVSKYPELESFGFHTIFDFKVQKTNLQEGYHIWHSEVFNIDTSPRILAWTLYLNDIEEGGETEFLYQSLRVSPKTGTLCIFPAYFTHLHRGNPPLSGVKYIATGWVEFYKQENE